MSDVLGSLSEVSPQAFKPSIYTICVAVLEALPSFAHIASNRRLTTGQAMRLTNATKESTIPKPLFGEGPIMLVKSKADSSSLQIANLPLPTAAIM